MKKGIEDEEDQTEGEPKVGHVCAAARLKMLTGKEIQAVYGRDQDQNIFSDILDWFAIKLYF